MLGRGLLLLPVWGFPPALASPPHQGVCTHPVTTFQIFDGYERLSRSGGWWHLGWSPPSLPAHDLGISIPPQLCLQAGAAVTPTRFKSHFDWFKLPKPSLLPAAPSSGWLQELFSCKTPHFWEPSVCNWGINIKPRQTALTVSQAHLGSRHSQGAACQETKSPRI